MKSRDALERLARRLEQADSLDAPSDAAARVLGRLLAPRALTDVLSGTPLGHPLHPVLVAVPIGSWTAASWLDATGGSRRAATRLVGLGTLAAVPTALSGMNDWLTTVGGERRVGATHGALNSVALVLYSASWVARRRGRWSHGVVLALAGAAALGGAGWLGGHLVYGMGVGVDTTSFQQLPDDWTDVAAEPDVTSGRGMVGDAGGVPVLLARDGRRIVAMADRCTHRGGPLHEGQIVDECVICPWHDSVFKLADGSVVSGPATRPQPTLEVRVVDGRVEVRRAAEVRSLRTNPAGV